MFIKNHLNSLEVVSPGLVTTDKSITVADHNLSLKTLITQYIRNIGVPSFNAPDAEFDMSDFQHMDKFAQIDAAKRYRERVAVLNAEQDLRRSKNADLKRKAEIDRLVDAELAKRNLGTN